MKFNMEKYREAELHLHQCAVEVAEASTSVSQDELDLFMKRLIVAAVLYDAEVPK